MRVLLISPNEEILPDPVFPLGLAFLAGALEKAGHTYRVIDFCVQPVDELPRTIKSFAPDAVCISIRNVDNVAYPHSTSYYPQYAALCKTVRQLSDRPIILGGAGFSLFAEQLLQELDADFGIIGSGEEPLLALLSALEEKGAFGAIPNLLSRTGDSFGRPRSKSRGNITQTQPARQGFPLAMYYDQGGMANIQTKRGCPFNCIYCSYPLIEGNVARTRPIGDVLAEITTLVAAGYDEIYFVDSVFNYPIDYAKQLCRSIIDEKIAVRWTCYGSPYGIDEEAIRLFRQSGCIGIEFGTDALSPVTLNAMGKSFSVDDVSRVSKLCTDYDLPFCHAVLAGGPGETLATFNETVDRLAAMQPTAVVFMTGIRIIPGTALFDLAVRESIITAETDMLQPVFYLSEPLRPLLEKEIKRLSRLHKNWIFPGHSIRSTPLLAKKLRKQGFRGPLWLNLAQKSR